MESRDTVVGDTEDARKVIEALGSKPKLVKGDVFEAKDRPNVPEREKPTEAQLRARLENIKKPGKLVGYAQRRKNK